MSTSTTCQECGRVYNKPINFCLSCGTKMGEGSASVQKQKQSTGTSPTQVSPAAVTTQTTTCQHCGREYTDPVKFCLTCGHKMGDLPTEGFKQTRFRPTEEVRVARKTPQQVTMHYFRDITAVLWVFVLGSLLVLVFYEFWWVTTIILVVIYTWKNQSEINIEYPRSSPRSNSPIISGMILAFLTLFTFFDYFAFTFAIMFVLIVIAVVLYQFIPPKYIIDRYYKSQPQGGYLIVGTVLYLVFLFQNLPVAYFIYIIFVALQINEYHSKFDLELGEAALRETASQATLDLPVQPYLIPATYHEQVGQRVPDLSLSILTQNVEALDHEVTEQIRSLHAVVDSYQNINAEYEEVIPKIQEELDEILKEGDEKANNPEYLDGLNNSITRLIQNHENLDQRFNEMLETTPAKIEKIQVRVEHLNDTIKDLQKETSKKINEAAVIDFGIHYGKLQDLQTSLVTHYQLIITKLEEQRKMAYEARMTQITAREIAEAERQTVKSFQLRGLASEKIVSNLFAYIGVAFLIFGFIAAMTFSYINFIRPIFPSNVETSTALIGVSLLYLLAAIVSTVPVFILSKFNIRAKIIPRIFISVGILLVQLTTSVQTLYFDNLDDLNTGFPLIGFGLGVLFFALAYRLTSQAIGFFASEFMIGMIYISSSGELFPGGQQIAALGVSIMFLVFFAMTIFLMLRKQVWLPLALYDFFAPATFLLSAVNGDILLPEFLALIVASTNVFLMIKDKFPTPKPFSHFITTVSLIYPNILAYYFIFVFKEDIDTTTLGSFYITTLFMGFFALYWIYILFEEELYFSFKIPVSLSLKGAQMILKEFHRRLNWLMLSSLVILFVVAIRLLQRDANLAVLMMGVLMAFFAIIGIIKNLERLVSNSTILMIVEAEFFYVAAIFGEGDSGGPFPPISAIFLLSFTSLLYVLNKYQPTLNVFTNKISADKVAIFVVLAASFNYFMAAQSKKFDTLVILIAVIQFILLFEIASRIENKNRINANILYLIVLGLALIFFGSGLSHRGPNSFLPQDTLSSDLGEHVLINLPFVILISYIYYVALTGREFLLDEVRDQQKLKSGLLGRLTSGNTIHVMAILLNLLPYLIISYGFAYFYKPAEHQGAMFAYLALYFISLPVLIIISRKRRSETFNVVSSLAGYYMFLTAFIVLGAAQEVYKAITGVADNPDAKRPDTIIPLELAIFYFTLLLLVTIAWTIYLSRDEDKNSTNKRMKTQNTSSGGTTP